MVSAIIQKSSKVRNAAAPDAPPAESYEAIRLSRNRAYLLALVAWPIAGLALASMAYDKANQEYVPPVVLTLDTHNHVAKSEIGTPAVLSSKDAVIESELARYVTERYTLDRAFRQDHIDYVRLHSASDVADRFNHEMDAKNRDNPYYSIAETTVRRVRETRVRILDRDDHKAEATFTTYNDGNGDNKTVYWHVLFRYDFVKQALTPQNRYINGTGFMVTGFEPNTEPGAPAPSGG
ncbi:type IV secretion system protein [Paraburkholderia fungorum]|uniref:type IV secretion system protein n=1 Tax=Paraburkholderia fungorum TaxID=134537 RepID=UPI002096A893|nr:type IV secretion system protein [Paraburkholderia fungorum]USX11064.1 type IV secretion system protein [Paraburkholderia fungorum]